MVRICDLHTHSTYSDGTFSPEQLVRLAEKKGISAVALCDHNTVAGLPEFLAAAAKTNVEAVPGVEFSTEYRGVELHILGLFVKPQHYAAVTEKLKQMLSYKEQSNLALVEALQKNGLELDYWAIKAATPDGQVNRAVIAAEMLRKGCCGSLEEAFDKWLSLERGYYHPPRRLDALDVIRFIKSIGAVAVLAHPFLSLGEPQLHEFLREAVDAGLDAMEVFYSKFSAEQTKRAEEIATQYGLLYSGGSDFHGANKPDTQLGYGKNNLHISYCIYENLAQRQKFV